MKTLFNLFAILTENFNQNAKRTITILEFVVNEQWDQLAEFVKTKFMGRFIDPEIMITTGVSGKTILNLLDELEKALIEKGIPLHKYDNGKFYHPDILSWFPDAKNSTSSTLCLARLPKEGMTEGEMIAEAKTLGKKYEHNLAEYIKAIIALVKSNYFTKKNTYFLGFLLEKLNGNTSCRVDGGVGGVGEFYLDVDEVDESYGWYGGTSLVLGN
jgi:hypothetical protein